MGVSLAENCYIMGVSSVIFCYKIGVSLAEICYKMGVSWDYLISSLYSSGATSRCD